MQIDSIYVQVLLQLVRLYKVHFKVTQHMAALLWPDVPGHVHHYAPVIETDWWDKSNPESGIGFNIQTRIQCGWKCGWGASGSKRLTLV